MKDDFAALAAASGESAGYVDEADRHRLEAVPS
jgi:hypothetical protein